MKLPAFQFYPGDWQKDPALKRCSHAAKGVWIDMLCLMFESKNRGILEGWTEREIAGAVGGDNAITLAAIEELTLKGVCKRSEEGWLYSERMVKDERKRLLCVEAGKRGGNPELLKTVKGESKGQSKRNSTPSSSSSSSEVNPPNPPAGGLSGIAGRLVALFERTEGIQPEEVELLEAAAPTEEQVELMARFRAARPEGIKLRTTLKQLLRHWIDEMDKARAWGQTNKPKPPPLPAPSQFEEQFQTIRGGFDIRRDMPHIWTPSLEEGLRKEIEKLPLDAWDEMPPLLRKNCEEMIG